jgi:hypothetical protein
MALIAYGFNCLWLELLMALIAYGWLAGFNCLWL